MLSRRSTSVALIALAFACLSLEVPAGPVNINTADAATLARELNGVGMKRAQAIVDYRSKHGPFKSAEELALVKGFGKKAIEKNRQDIRVDSSRLAPKPAAVVPAAPRKP